MDGLGESSRELQANLVNLFESFRIGARYFNRIR